MKLTDTQTIILSAAANRDDGLAVVPAKLPAAARNAVAKSLETQGLVEPQQPVPAAQGWRLNEDGTHVGLRITRAGVEALNIDQSKWPPHTLAEENAHTGPHTASAETVAREAAAVADALDAAPKVRTTLRDAAAAVLAAWEDEANRETDIVAAMEAPMAALRLLLADRTNRAPAAPRSPRPGTKQEAVIEMLRTKDGATVAQISARTGWASHTVRGFFAGLKKKGLPVAAKARIRPNETEDGSTLGAYTIYHLAE